MGRANVTAGLADTIVDVVAGFGADPTYNNDSTSAFQAAITTLQISANYRGGTIHVPAGHYKITSTLSFTAYSGVHNIYLVGDGPDNTVLDFSGIGASSDGIAWGIGSHFGVKNLVIQNATRDGLSIYPGGLNSGSFCQQWIIDNCRLQANGRDGIRFANCFMGTVSNCWSWGNTGVGFNFLGFHTSIYATRCWAGAAIGTVGLGGGNGLYGWELNGMAYSSFDSCGSDANTLQGWAMSNMVANTFTSCGAESNERDGFLCGSGSTTGIPLSIQGIHGNVFNGCWGSANSQTGTSSWSNTYAAFLNVVGNSGITMDCVIIGGSAVSNGTGDYAIAANGTGGAVTININGFIPQGFSTGPVIGNSVYSGQSTSGAGTIVNSSGVWGNFFATCTSATNISTAADTIIPYNNVITDNVSGWNSGGSDYVTQSGGTYAIGWACKTTESVSGDNMQSELWIAGSRYADGSSASTTTAGAGLASSGSIQLYLAYGTTIQVKARSGQTANNLNGVASSNWLSVARVS